MSNAMLREYDEPELDFAKAKEFAGVLAGHFNSATITIMVSIGHKMGLFDVMGRLPPSTSEGIAKASGLNERYIREWLAVLVTGRIVEYDPKRKEYWLPAEHAASMTRGAPLGNYAIFAQFPPILGSAQNELIEHFKTGGGTHYHDYPGFHDYMAEASDQSVVNSLETVILPLVPGLKEKLEAGIDVLDVGCGKGHAMIALAKLFPKSRFHGYDFSANAIEEGRRLIATSGATNVKLEIVDMSEFAEINRYDLVTTFDAVHDQKHPQDLIKGIHAALKPGGTYLMQDIGGSAYLEKNLDFPLASFLYAASALHCMAISLGQGGDGLGTMWGWETAQAMLENARFASVEKQVLEHDPINVWFISRKAE
jgi:2-polyprenyl-3-methyl-5-hydroxy-6-metoxy-1,4-benzoquinol methylase